jgi:hypothetical protein
MTMQTHAVISADGIYRYELGRTWDESLPPMTFVMLNPSTADAELDDPTIRRCIGFAKREGAGGILVANLYAFRATDPKVMLRAVDPVGSENDMTILRLVSYALMRGGRVVVAWGANADARRVRHVRKLLYPLALHCLGVTKDGHPKHPLYISGDAPLIEWPAV